MRNFRNNVILVSSVSANASASTLHSVFALAFDTARSWVSRFAAASPLWGERDFTSCRSPSSFITGNAKTLVLQSWRGRCGDAVYTPSQARSEGVPTLTTWGQNLKSDGGGFDTKTTVGVRR